MTYDLRDSACFQRQRSATVAVGPESKGSVYIMPTNPTKNYKECAAFALGCGTPAEPTISTEDHVHLDGSMDIM